MIDLSVVVPVYNEEGNLGLLHQRLTAVMHTLGVTYEFVFINDGSRDGSVPLLYELAAQDPQHVRFIDLSRNFGHQIAVSAGLDHARGQAIVIIDADLQDPPETIVDLYRKMESGFEVVYARRNRRQGESWFKLVTARWFYRILRKITTIEIPVDTGDFRIIDSKVADVLRRMPERDKFLRGQIAWIGFRQTFVMYDRHERHAGQTGYTFRKMLHFALNGITGFSDVPLKIVTYFGVAVSLISMLVGIFALYSRFITRDYVPGWASTIVSVLFIGGIQMISIGIIGEYLSRMNSNLRQRPLYIVRDTNCEISENTDASA
jgi:dolichol-phosphate mannosyltransferase